ncbi:MAG: hypothetical protein MI861_11045, partial [Pirellulales bacterium]|nr:hypothetical protein [Pirellulales bacterium]
SKFLCSNAWKRKRLGVQASIRFERELAIIAPVTYGDVCTQHPKGRIPIPVVTVFSGFLMAAAILMTAPENSAEAAQLTNHSHRSASVKGPDPS